MFGASAKLDEDDDLPSTTGQPSLVASEDGSTPVLKYDAMGADCGDRCSCRVFPFSVPWGLQDVLFRDGYDSFVDVLCRSIPPAFVPA